MELLRLRGQSTRSWRHNRTSEEEANAFVADKPGEGRAFLLIEGKEKVSQRPVLAVGWLLCDGVKRALRSRVPLSFAPLRFEGQAQALFRAGLLQHERDKLL